MFEVPIPGPQGICSGVSFCCCSGWKGTAFVSLDRHNEVPEMGGLNHRNLLSYGSADQMSNIKVQAWLWPPSLQQHSPHFQAGAHHVGILLQCSLWCRGSKVGPGIVRAFSREGLWEDGSPVGDAAKESDIKKTTAPSFYHPGVEIFRLPLQRKNVPEPKAHHIWMKPSCQARSLQSNDSARQDSCLETPWTACGKARAGSRRRPWYPQINNRRHVSGEVGYNEHADPCYSKHGLWTSGFVITWELDGQYGALPRTDLTQNLKEKNGVSGLHLSSFAFVSLSQ
ncbi:uncharacterized protein LOC116572051 isoform X2 [Mustela erminea]|uniref:uncharacterized protein LOC116572051 isoform X2 n=1 Tax=Mustela erminea TaxID=36723 RepID=UPI0013866EFF|nr:uncharacterized protein LOC116572051 isoform X2 [Mustela erminea]